MQAVSILTASQPTKKVILYVGANTDSYPITVNEFREQYTHFIFVDYQPSRCNKYDKMNKDEESMMRKIKDTSGGALISVRESDDHWIADLRSGTSKLIYYFNVKDTKITTHASLRSWLPFVEALFVKGYNPASSVVRALPNLKYVFSTKLCRSSPKIEHWTNAVPSGVIFRPLTCHTLRYGDTWIHGGWVEDEKKLYPMSEMSNVFPDDDSLEAYEAKVRQMHRGEKRKRPS